MVCKVLFFEYGKREKTFFETNNSENIIDINFVESKLDNDTQFDVNTDDISMISISSKSVVTKEILDKFKNLRLVATRTTGTEHIDLKTCFERNIAVVNVEPYQHKKDYLLINSFVGMKSFLCGGKDNRVI